MTKKRNISQAEEDIVEEPKEVDKDLAKVPSKKQRRIEYHVAVDRESLEIIGVFTSKQTLKQEIESKFTNDEDEYEVVSKCYETPLQGKLLVCILWINETQTFDILCIEDAQMNPFSIHDRADEILAKEKKDFEESDYKYTPLSPSPKDDEEKKKDINNQFGMHYGFSFSLVELNESKEKIHCNSDSASKSEEEEENSESEEEGDESDNSGTYEKPDLLQGLHPCIWIAIKEDEKEHEHEIVKVLKNLVSYTCFMAEKKDYIPIIREFKYSGKIYEQAYVTVLHDPSRLTYLIKDVRMIDDFYDVRVHKATKVREILDDDMDAWIEENGIEGELDWKNPEQVETMREKYDDATQNIHMLVDVE